MIALGLSSLLLQLSLSGVALSAAASDTSFIRVNQLGYLPDAPKVAVVCSLAEREIAQFRVVNSRGKRVLGPLKAEVTGAFGPCVRTHRLDFSRLRLPGRYRIVAGTDSSREFRIGANVYRGAADTMLYYMRQQRSGWNPLFKDSVHKKDAILVDHPTRSNEFIPVSGGWADASDYLQYLTTSANATYLMLAAFRDHKAVFADDFRADGTAGRNGVADVLDEARHGLEWMLRMHPDDSTLLNQIGDDRDHSYWDLPPTDSSDYGWGKGGARPVYACTGAPQGLFQHRNRSTGVASTAGKFASAFALGARVYATRDPAFSARLRAKAITAYALGKRFPGVCQTAPARSPYFYEEDNWVDDMELGAAELSALTRDTSFIADAMRFAAQEPTTPWMGADTARHYQWFPWHNNGHYSTWRSLGISSPRPIARARRDTLVEYYRRGIEAVVGRANNGFRIGVPFIWCSNNLMASFATQAMLYRTMSGDTRYREYEAAALDWLFGVNPWGVSMVIGLPHDGNFARDPHSVVAKELRVELTGGLLDGPVYRSIYQNLKGIRLHSADEYAAFNTGFIVYHDDLGDYSTNEPIMDGTANLLYLLAAYADVK